VLPAEDIFAIQDLIAQYGHIVDAKEWGRLSELFTDDLVFVPWQEDLAPTNELSELISRWSNPEFPHPTAHHATNILIEPDEHGVVAVTWKGLAVHRDGRTRSFVYHERLRKTDLGWRGFWRRVELRPTDVPVPTGTTGWG
jgi:hypothetical protein